MALDTSDTDEVTVLFIEPNGDSTAVRDQVGRSVMDFAVDHGVNGIYSQCGGACICTMCHCFVDRYWFDQAGPVSLDEREMLEYIPTRQPTSRLACQVIVSRQLDGMKIYVEAESGITP
ncbi:MAG: 2Fe-2S iron-sulfur cluster binding domain-containing protein [Gammaproteobacteria bacterium]|nr:2Fe-2S iron-sulfur cluster binding domain-containing protein [Gammaproteobacteria bacterium]